MDQHLLSHEEVQSTINNLRQAFMCLPDDLYRAGCLDALHILSVSVGIAPSQNMPVNLSSACGTAIAVLDLQKGIDALRLFLVLISETLDAIAITVGCRRSRDQWIGKGEGNERE